MSLETAAIEAVEAWKELAKDVVLDRRFTRVAQAMMNLSKAAEAVVNDEDVAPDSSQR